MGVKKTLQIAVVGAGLIAAWLFAPRAAKDVSAQFAGYFSEQTVTYAYSGPTSSPVPFTRIPLPNIGQAGHSLLVENTGGTTGCPVWLEGSADGSNWTVLVGMKSLNVLGLAFVAFAQGYYPYLSIVVNPYSSSTCGGGETGIYIGYQFPPSAPSSYIGDTSGTSVGSALNIESTLMRVFPDYSMLTRITCYNPGTSVAFLQINDSTSPALGAPIFQVPIPAGASYDAAVSIIGSQQLNAGASTTFNGTTVVSTDLECTFQINPFGPFYSPGK